VIKLNEYIKSKWYIMVLQIEYIF